MKEEQSSVFPVGYHNFHRNKTYNYQLNRWHSLGVIRFKDIHDVGGKIHSFEEWKTEMLRLAQTAESENRYLNAAFYYRAAEFYTMPGDEPGKEFFYNRFTEHFYEAVKDEELERISVPYETGYLPAIRIKPNGEKNGTLLLHGGFDSFLEEWFHMIKYFAQNGLDVICFEGPGQGSVLLKQGVHLDYRWEKPVKAVLDYFQIQEASLFGLSMGGWFCLRAAAFEPRIRKVIASGHAVDYSRIPPAFARAMMLFFIKNLRSYTANSFEKVAEKNNVQGWQTRNLAHITGLSPLQAFEYSLNLNAENLHCEKITQDVLYLTGRNDHFISYKMHNIQLKLLTNAASVTDRVFTKEEHAQNHCQIGNIGLMLDECIRWMKSHPR